MRRRMVGGSGCLRGRRMQVRYINAVLWQPGAAHGNSLLGWRADAECAKIRGARFRETQDWKCRLFRLRLAAR
jgi:hypothetical protein